MSYVGRGFKRQKEIEYLYGKWEISIMYHDGDRAGSQSNWTAENGSIMT